MYSAQHEFTCQRRPGSWLHEAIDVQSYCEWGVDYLKLDGCSGRGYSTANTSWIKFRAVRAAVTGGRPFLFRSLFKRFPDLLLLPFLAVPLPSHCLSAVLPLSFCLRLCLSSRFRCPHASLPFMLQAIDECSKTRGFPMVLSVESCDDPTGCGLWIGELANLWRTCGDIQATFASVMNNVAENTKMAKWAGPTGGPLGGGHW
eukprot:SAG22_NODE_528_length_9431_cov_7.192135_5_plen_202_part_00